MTAFDRVRFENDGGSKRVVLLEEINIGPTRIESARLLNDPSPSGRAT